MGRIKDRLIFDQKKMEVTNPAACLLVTCGVVRFHKGTQLKIRPPTLIPLNNFQAFEKRRDRKDQSAYAKERKEVLKKVRTFDALTLHHNGCSYSL